MCLVLGALGGALAATTTRTEPVQSRFTPAREPAFDFSLRDQDGRPARLADARGSVIALTFIYTSCRDLCPAEGSDISTAIDMAGDGVVAYIVSVDPAGDTPKRAREWLERRSLTGRGRYLLGARDTLQPVWRHYGIAPINATRAEAVAAAEGADAFRAANPPRPGGSSFEYEAPAAAGRAAAGRGRCVSGSRRPCLSRPRPAHRRLGLRALGVRAADRQAWRTARRHPVRVARAECAGTRYANPAGRAELEHSAWRRER